MTPVETHARHHAASEAAGFLANRSLRWMFWGGVGAVAVLRLIYCGLMPVVTGDAERNLLYGLAVSEHGVGAERLPLVALSRNLERVAWSHRPFIYPIVALGFFTLVAKVSPTLFALKLMLTAIEALNTWLVVRFSGDRVLGLLYWASPISIWWVSREGQFEPLQNAFVLGSLVVLRTRWWPAAFACVGIGIQTKVSALLIFPYLAYATCERLGETRRRAAWLCVCASLLAASFLPNLLIGGVGPLESVRRATAFIRINPLYWDIRDQVLLSWYGRYPWLVLWMWTGATVLLVMCLWVAVTNRDVKTWVSLIAPIAYLVALRVHTAVQTWYLLSLAAFIVPVVPVVWRRRLLATLLLADPHALGLMLYGQFGYLAPPAPFTPFDHLGLLR
jgi:hypothetical protein